ncbi:MAG: 5-bromo-4-chloroindolyl phosphate hydrolysis family protein [Selenomonadaceae bacterium]|nr:5-bromo-4-chloroindolyl phosphate hydrolysis family protein [Selenomonadaceae bacterium]
MGKILLGALALVSAVAGIMGEVSAAALTVPLIASGAYLVKLGNDDREKAKEAAYYGLITESNAPKLSFHDNNIDAERQRYLAERYEKARSDFFALKEGKAKTRDKALHAQLDKMEAIAGRLLSYLAEHPEKISVASKFIDYYQDRAVLLLNRYFDLTMTGLSTPEVNTRKEKVLRAIFLMDEAYEAEFHKVLSADFLDLDAELEVIEGNMESGGITDEDFSKINDSAPSVDIPGSPKSTSERIAAMRRLEGYRGNFPVEYDKKNVIITKVIQSSLAIFLGSFGAHKFYLGKNVQGIIYCIFFWTAIPGLVGMIEGLRYLVMRIDDYYVEYYSKMRRNDGDCPGLGRGRGKWR